MPKREKGITLIALVVTIIVLLIISGITIGTIKDKKSILKQASETGDHLTKESVIEKIEADLYQEKAKTGRTPTKAELKELIKNKGYNNGDLGEDSFVTKDGEYTIEYSEISGWENVSEASKVVTKTEKNNYRDSNGDYATIPAGFTVSGLEDEQKISKGLVIYDIPESELASVNWETASVKYNQFVWIPVESEGDYQRDYTYPSYDSSLVSETTSKEMALNDTEYLPTGIKPQVDNTTNNVIAEKQAVAKYNGFYVARYEAGYESSKVVSKKNKALYTNKSQTEFKTIAKTMYGDTNPNVRSAMCSGIQWDMIMKFVNKEKDGTGNVYDVRKYNENRHSGIIEISGNNLTDKVQNIYDLEGNAWEFVAEKNTTRFPWNTRGGMYSNFEDYNCASICCVSTGNANASVTARLVMYIM